MNDKFILGLNNFTNFNNASDYKITEPIVCDSLNLFRKIKSAMDFPYFKARYLLFKDLSYPDIKILNGVFIVDNLNIKYLNLDNLDNDLSLSIIVDDSKQEHKTINKKDLKLFFDILDITHSNIRVFLNEPN